jgi:hypothetical protein
MNIWQRILAFFFSPQGEAVEKQIAQIVVVPVAQAIAEEVAEPPPPPTSGPAPTPPPAVTPPLPPVK